MADLKWNDEEIFTRVATTVEDRMERACIVVRDNVKILLNRGNSRGTDPSKPGEPPKKVSGRLFRSVSYRVAKDADGNAVGLVGSNVPYEPRLELGFAGTDSLGRKYRQAPRPAFRPGYYRSIEALKKIFGIR